MGFMGTARYELLGKLGEGGMGIVYEAYDRTRDMRVALKTLRHLDAENLYRFKREFRALSTLSHPNIITLYELGAEGENWFLTMELVEGEDLISYVRCGRLPVEVLITPTGRMIDEPETETAETVTSDMPLRGPGPVALYFGTAGLPTPPARLAPLDEIVDIVRLRAALGQLAEALHALHSANLVHRDLKPSNVRVTARGRLVLMDFGVVAETRRHLERDSDRFAVGTPQYMAPEQARGSKPTAAADWYAFGVLMYLALTGRLPYEGGRTQILQTKQTRDPLPPRMFTADIPRDLERLCMDLLSRDPAERPTSHEVLDRLGIAVTDAATSAEFPALDISDSLFVGRVYELHALRQAYSVARGGGTVCVFVQGPSGIGKSRLVERFVHELGTLGRSQPLVLKGRCQARESLAYKAFDGVMDDLSRHLARLPEHRRKAVLPVDVDLAARLFPALRRIPECQAPTAFNDHNPLQQRLKAVTALRTLLTSLARHRPVLIYTEDIQWADRDSLDLLMSLLRAPAPAGLMILATLRTDELDSDAGRRSGDPGAQPPLTSLRFDGGGDAPALLAHVIDTLGAELDFRQLDLGPLSEAEQRELMVKITSLPEFRGMSQYLGDPLWRESAGNPMLLAELARSTQEQDALASAGELHLEDVLWVRFTRLSDSARALMECVALAGEPLPLRVLARASSLSDSACERASASLLVVHLARISRTDHEPWLVVYHNKVGEAIRERLATERIPAVHRNLAQAMEGWASAPAAVLADHWLAAGERVKAAVYRFHAARSAAEKLAFDRAAELYRSVLELLPEPSDDHELEIMRCRTWIGLAEEMIFAERHHEALVLLDRAQAKAAEHQLIEDLAAIHYLRGHLHFYCNRFEDSLAEQEKAREHARQAGSPEREARALSGLGDADYMRGHIISAYQHFDRCIHLCREHHFSDIEAANLSMRGLTRFFQNDLASALQDSLNAAAIASSIRHRRAEVVARSSCIPWTLFEMGHIHQARRELQDALKMAREVGARRLEPLSLNHLARIMALKGRRAKARSLIDDSLRACREIGMAFAGPMALGTLALITDDAAERQSAFDEAEEILQAGAASHNHLYFYRDAIDLALDMGDADRMERYAQALEGYTRAQPLPWSRFFAERGRALAAHVRGHGDQEQLRGLVSEARKASLHTAARALEQALAST